MKIPGYLGLAATALLMLASCNDNSDTSSNNSDTNGDKPSLAKSDEAAEIAPRQAGDVPAKSPTGDVPDTPAPQEIAPASPPAIAQSAAASPPAAYLQCRACHSTEPGKHGIGPSLAGIASKPAAGVPGFRYSSALKASGIVWNRESLDQWLAGPTRMVPGTRMVRSVRSAEQRKAVIDYLETLK
jgi:cytochrome c